MQHGTFRWGEAAGHDVIQDVSMKVESGKLIAIVGPVGAGKSALLGAMLGELERVTGDSTIRGSVAYVPQEAWIRNASVRQNITCGLPGRLDKDRYERAVDVCCLSDDIRRLAAGDRTEIGERGINLSGGQKQRVNLARAVYARRDVYLLDDPLSAVDAHVGHELFKRCIQNELSHATRVLVTHQIQFLPEVDEIWMMEAGQIVRRGTFVELTASGVSFASLVSESEDKALTSASSGWRTSGSSDAGSSAVWHSGDIVIEQDVDVHLDDEEGDEEDDGTNGNRCGVHASGTLIQEEERCTGAVGSHVYLRFLRLYGNAAFAVCFVTLSVGFEVLRSAQKVWLSKWSPEWHGSGDMQWGLVVYLLAGLGSAFFITIRHVMWYRGSAEAAGSLHESMLRAMMHAPISFFQSTPQGRILNRFARDQSVVDVQLPLLLSDAVFCGMALLSKLIVIIMGAPSFVLVLCPIIIIYLTAHQFYRRTATEMKRLLSITASPIFAHFTETLDGLMTIRAFNLQEEECSTFIDRLSTKNRVAYHDMCCNAWLGIVNASLASGITMSVSVVVVLSMQFDVLDVTFGSLALMYSLQVAGMMNYLVKCTAYTEARMSKVERMLHYCDLESEAPQSVDHRKPHADWPDRGEIEFKSLEMRYRPGLEPALKHTSFHITGGEKVGVVGRTGAGKSSLLLSLLRIVEPSNGQIIVDGVDVGTIGLRDLRARIGVIPQDAVLFSGSIRSNLDPHGSASDDDIWDALRGVRMLEYVEAQELQLSTSVESGGRNLSLGQRQLLCLARALLRESSILVMDEATASLDPDTDEAIQAAVRENFSNCTVLTIAHRLPTVIDSDRVLVLENGRVAELDSPAKLLQDSKSRFSELVRNTGRESEQYLRRAAKQAARRKHRT